MSSFRWAGISCLSLCLRTLGTAPVTKCLLPCLPREHHRPTELNDLRTLHTNIVSVPSCSIAVAWRARNTHLARHGLRPTGHAEQSARLGVRSCEISGCYGQVFFVAVGGHQNALFLVRFEQEVRCGA